MDPRIEHERLRTRRSVLLGGARGLGGLALGSMLGREAAGLVGGASPTAAPGLETGPALLPHHRPTAKRMVYLFFSGGPSHIDTFDFKPAMRDIHGIELPESIRQGQRLTTMTSGQSSFPCVAPMFDFQKYGEHQTYVSELLPHTAKIVDEITLLKSLHTEAINHDPAITYINTGSQQPGKACLGSWLSYGLGSLNRDLPDFVVMISRGSGALQALYSRLWSSGFLPSKHQGVNFRSSGNPVLYLNNPPGIDASTRRRMLDGLARINQARYEETADPEIQTRISQYEMAYRMQTSVPELMDLSDEPESTAELYGPDARKPGTFAANCVLARRLLERGVRFVQLYHRGWDQHGNLPRDLRSQCGDVDQPSAALVTDLKQRGLLDDTVVVCGGEFGRTIYSQGALTEDNHGRDHHGRCFSTWIAGGGFARGIEYGKTDDFAYNIVDKPMHIRDLHATLLHTLGIDHERFTYRYLGLDEKLTGVEPARVVKEILA